MAQNKIIGLQNFTECLMGLLEKHNKNQFWIKAKSTPNMYFTFAGNMGCGKTKAAKLLSLKLYEKGLLSTSEYIFVNDYELFGQDVAETQSNIANLFTRRVGGVIEIDINNLYNNQHDANVFVSAFITNMQKQEYAKSLCIVFSGSESNITKFTETNPELKRRVINIHFKNYTNEELFQIFMRLAERKALITTSDHENIIYSYLCSIPRDHNFRNAHIVAELITDLLCRYGTHLPVNLQLGNNDTHKNKEETTQQNQNNNINDILNEITALRNSVSTLEEQLSNINSKVGLEDVVRDYAEKIHKFESDFYRKTQSPLLMQFIKIADMLRISINDCNKKSTIEDKYNFLLNDCVVQLIETIDKSILKPNKVEIFVSEVNSEFNEDIHRLYCETGTTDEGKVGKISKSILPGYFWRLPYVTRNYNTSEDEIKNYKLVLREEEVEIYKLNN